MKCEILTINGKINQFGGAQKSGNS